MMVRERPWPWRSFPLGQLQPPHVIRVHLVCQCFPSVTYPSRLLACHILFRLSLFNCNTVDTIHLHGCNSSPPFSLSFFRRKGQVSVDSVHAQSHPDPISDRRVPRLDRVSHIDLHAQPHFRSSLSSKRHIPVSPTPIHQPTTTLSKIPYASKKIPLYYTCLLPCPASVSYSD